MLSALLLVAIVATLLLVKSSENTTKEEEKETEIQEKVKAENEPPAFEIRHHNTSELHSLLRHYAASYPHQARVYSIGRSVRGVDLLVIEISDHPGLHKPGQPEVKLVGGIHGNEVVGRELSLYLIDYLLRNYQTLDGVRNFVNGVRLHIAPSINPDGYEDAVEGDCDGTKGRENANQVDLNRSFPDQFGRQDYDHAEPETTSVIRWTQSEPFVLSVALHGGALVVNYPFDSNAISANQYSISPDDEIFRYLAKVYSTNHGQMKTGKCADRCTSGEDEFAFKDDGITNGAAWYPINGGMQDWNYLQADCLELTIETGCHKYPSSAQLAGYLFENLNPLVKLIQSVHIGVRGFVFSPKGKPIENAVIVVEGIAKNVTTHKMGDYWRLLTPNMQYTISVHKAGYLSQSIKVFIEQLYTLNFTLYSSS